MRKRGLLLLAFVMACGGAQSGVYTTTPLSKPDVFATIAHVRVRVVDWETIAYYHPSEQCKFGVGSLDARAPNAVEAIDRVLHQKGYTVTFVWDNPYDYGPERPCTCNSPPDCLRDHGRTRMSIGWPTFMTGFRGSLAPDEAFLEVATTSDSYTTTSVTSTPTDTEVGHVTNASGQMIGTIYRRDEVTSVKETKRYIAIANGQLFVSGRAEPIYDVQAWSRKSDDIVPVIEELLAPIPKRH